MEDKPQNNPPQNESSDEPVNPIEKTGEGSRSASNEPAEVIEAAAVEEETPTPKSDGSEQFSLASVFLLTLAVAVLAAAIRTGLDMEGKLFSEIAQELLPPIIVGAILGFWLGFVIRFTRGHPPVSIAMGGLAGALAGAGGGAVLLVPHALWTLLAGSVVMIAFATVIRRLSRREA